MNRTDAEKLATDLVSDILRRYGPGISRHNKIGDTEVVYGEVFEGARKLYRLATTRHPIYSGYFDHYLHNMILKDCARLTSLGDRS